MNLDTIKTMLRSMLLNFLTPTIDFKIVDKRLVDNPHSNEGKLPKDRQFAIPTYGSDEAAGIDLRAMFSDHNMHSMTIRAGEVVKIPTGLCLDINNRHVAAVLLPRSGLGHEGLVNGNLVGLIDSDYQGQLFISCWNRSEQDMVVELGDRINQMVFLPVIHPTLNYVTDFFRNTARGEGGFTSTGIK